MQFLIDYYYSMQIEITDKQAVIIRQGICKLPIEMALETLLAFDEQVLKDKKSKITMAKIDGDEDE